MPYAAGLYYEEAGSGQPLILLHGNGEEHGYFVHQIEYFARRFRVVAPDTRGHGQSPRGEGAFSIRRFAGDLYRFMCDLGLKKAHILGFSDGGNIALCFALTHPEMVDRLVLNGANLDASGVKRSTQLPIEIGYKIASWAAVRGEKAKANAEMLGLMVNDPNIDPEDLGKINCPTLVVAGTKDMIKLTHTRLIADRLPDSRLVILKGDHFVANKNPRDFNAAVEAFLTQG